MAKDSSDKPSSYVTSGSRSFRNRPGELLSARRSEAFKSSNAVEAKQELSTAKSVFGFVFLLILTVAVIRVLTGHAPVTFTGFLERLQNAPSVPLDWLSVLQFNLGSSWPDWIAWLGSFIDFFMDCFRVALFVSVSVLNALVFLLYFLQWLFWA